MLLLAVRVAEGAPESSEHKQDLDVESIGSNRTPRGWTSTPIPRLDETPRAFCRQAQTFNRASIFAMPCGAFRRLCIRQSTTGRKQCSQISLDEFKVAGVFDYASQHGDERVLEGFERHGHSLNPAELLKFCTFLTKICAETIQDNLTDNEDVPNIILSPDASRPKYDTTR
jgi:hypothetical protein